MHASLSQQEAALLDTLAALLPGDTRMEKDALRVLVGSKGFEMGRNYLNLRSYGVVEEQETAPGFFRRLIGAQPKHYVALTQTGRDRAKPSENVPTVEGSAAAPDPEPRLTSPAQSTLDGKAEAAKRTKAPAKAGNRQRPPARPRLDDFTETLGGAPRQEVAPLRDPIRLEGLAEMLGLTDFQLTPAGQMLAERRWAEGRRDSEVALEILLVAVAHAVRLDDVGMARLDRDVVKLFFAEVEKDFAHLVSAGELSGTYLAQSVGSALAMLGPDKAAQAQLSAILEDPLLGAAPPATCPDEFFLPEDLS
ncbi:hypothetical protein [Paragemmobacter straminiformis]|uniref:Uncharacterized protein n=1 Tax=Paragemmobacter straminiformis TaxID=2045119 RepID=A0A842I5M9_9RHOB|nr:hypothetical protein [Gemmobacter straminiformis]MBC2835130.1 hypothetical protein [Gemmobacter straminiformis]